MKSKSFKRLVTPVLSMAVAAGSFSALASIQAIEARADSWPYDYMDESGVQYGTTEDGLFVSGYKGVSKNIVIPDSYAGKNVVGITNNVFRETNIESVEIGDSVRWIYSDAFADCKQLAHVTFGTSVRYLDFGVFYGCEKLDSVKLPASLKQMRTNVFTGTDFYNHEENWLDDGLYLDGWLIAVRQGTAGYFKIAEGTTQVADGIFREGAGARITKLGIPASLKESRTNFSGKNSALTSFVVDPGNLYYSYNETDHILYNKDETRIREVVGTLPGIYRIPSHVTEIGSHAFPATCAAKAIVIPKSVTHIENGAFGDVVERTGLLCEAKKQPAGWDREWAVTEDVWLESDFAGANIHYGYRSTAVSASTLQGLYTGWSADVKVRGKTITMKKGDLLLANARIKSGTNGYVRWVSTRSSVLKVDQAAAYTTRFYMSAKKTGTAWLKAKNSKGKVIARYKVRVMEK